MLVVDGNKFSWERVGGGTICGMEQFAETMCVLAFTFNSNDLSRYSLSVILFVVSDGFDVKMENSGCFSSVLIFVSIFNNCVWISLRLWKRGCVCIKC